ncbi:MAG TPA: RecX family transcriptional regulator [Bacteroidota bacterium]|nr:RecX family transcriptional regulator [Bacteroidota bacterium]
MIVTKIERQKRNPHRVNIFLDNEFKFGIHEATLTKFGLRNGDELDQKIIETISIQEEYHLAHSKALQLISRRLRTERELRFKLLEKEFQPKAVDFVIEKLRKSGLVDDSRFARAYVHDIQLRKPAGARFIQQQLRLKGVPLSIIQTILHEHFDDETTQKLALKVASTLTKRFKSSRKKIDSFKQRQRIIQLLLRRGFDWQTINTVLPKLFGRAPTVNQEN